MFSITSAAASNEGSIAWQKEAAASAGSQETAAASAAQEVRAGV